MEQCVFIAKQFNENGLYRYREVVESLIEDSEIEEDTNENINKVLLTDLPKEKSKLKIGEFLVEELPPLDFGRIAVQTAKHVIFQKKMSFTAMQAATPVNQ